MSWYTIIDYNISIHPTKDTIVYLHIGQIEYRPYYGASSMFEVWIKDIKRKMPNSVHQSDTDKKPAKQYYAEKCNVILQMQVKQHC